MQTKIINQRFTTRKKYIDFGISQNCLVLRNFLYHWNLLIVALEVSDQFLEVADHYRCLEVAEQ